MKRPLALIGITYLSVLAVAFYFLDDAFTLVLALAFALATLVTVFLKVDSYKRKTAIIQFSVVTLACCANLFHTYFVYQPTVDRLDGSTADITALLVEEPRDYYGNTLYTLETEAVNGESNNIKINLISGKAVDMDEFDKIECTLSISETTSPSNLSKKIFFTAYADYDFAYTVTHTEEKPPYYFAIKLRQKMGNALDSILPPDCSSLCKAVLLGDKYSMSNEVRSDFSNCGVTFLIVVSGMHLVVVCKFVLFVVEKLTRNRIVRSATVLVFVFAFMAVTGFTPSIVRAGTMTFIIYLGKIVHRDGDALNSLGLSAIVLTLSNPYSVGDVGMLLSFAATAGIILWCDKISDFIMSKLDFVKLGRRLVEYYVSLFSASLAASLWVIPITVLAFGTISPYSVIVSVIVSPFVSAIIVCSLLSVVFFYTFTFMAYPFALVAGLCSEFVIFVISGFARLPFVSVNADRIYFYVWVGLSVVLAVFGYFVKEKGRYVKYSVIFSLCVLIFGYSLYTIVDINTASLTVYNTQGGVTAIVRNGENSSVISCGGSYREQWFVINDISNESTEFDYVIIPSKNNDYDAYLNSIQREFDVSQILVYDNKQSGESSNYRFFGDNVCFSLHLNNKTTNTVINIDGTTFQYLKTQGKTILFAPQNADLSLLPQEYKKADFLLSNGLPENYDELQCGGVILTAYDEEVINQAETMFENVICIDDKIMVDIS